MYIRSLKFTVKPIKLYTSLLTVIATVKSNKKKNMIMTETLQQSKNYKTKPLTDFLKLSIEMISALSQSG